MQAWAVRIDNITPALLQPLALSSAAFAFIKTVSLSSWGMLYDRDNRKVVLRNVQKRLSGNHDGHIPVAMKVSSVVGRLLKPSRCDHKSHISEKHLLCGRAGHQVCTFCSAEPSHDERVKIA